MVDKKRTQKSKKNTKKETTTNKQKLDEKKEQKDVNQEPKNVKKDRNNLIFILLFISVGILVISSLFQNNVPEPKEEIIIDDSKVEFNNFTFEKKEDGMWYTYVLVDDFLSAPREYEVPFYYNPYDVLDIEFRRGLESIFLDVPNIYITINPEYDSKAVIAGTEISKILGKVWFKKVKAGLTKQVNGSEFPIITCEDINSKTRVIEFRLGDVTKIFQEEGCIIIQGTDEQELIRAADKMAFRMLKIMMA
ncbi:hypothetical protein HOD20_04340 [archaeon]|jgi:hypothetical protein|nr:hypothetical protein [archaeon]MBT4351734.1 hypothetical protein [archaeon]MBT4646757.1 hypothetical protein [archaeon]MBT6822050.1 hypothetical protein [archaeon]MBT7391436.1 hypothetical protein [archaeon]